MWNANSFVEDSELDSASISYDDHNYTTSDSRDICIGQYIKQAPKKDTNRHLWLGKVIHLELDKRLNGDH